MGRKKDPKSKDNILRETFILLLEKGYANVSIKNITEVTKLSKGAIYHHFESKEEIYNAILETYYFKLLNSGYEENEQASFKEDIEALYTFAAELFSTIEHLSKPHLNFPIRNFFSFQLESETHEQVRTRTVETVVQYRNTIHNIVKKAQKKNEIDNTLDSESIALQIVGYVRRYCY